MGRDIARRCVSAIVIAACTLPASVIFAKIFWIQQRVTNGGLGGKAWKSSVADTLDMTLMKGNSLDAALNTLRLRLAVDDWRIACEELLVSVFKEKLVAIRMRCLRTVQDDASNQKAAREGAALAKGLVMQRRAAMGDTYDDFAAVVRLNQVVNGAAVAMQTFWARLRLKVSSLQYLSLCEFTFYLVSPLLNSTTFFALLPLSLLVACHLPSATRHASPRAPFARERGSATRCVASSARGGWMRHAGGSPTS